MQKKISEIFYANDDNHNFFNAAMIEISPQTQLILGDGEQLMQHLNTSDFFPDVIFLYLNMPGRNGFQVLKEIKFLDKTKDIPVVIFSTSDDPTTIQTTRLLGANLYLAKPSSFSALKKSIRYILSINRETLDTSEESFSYRAN